MRDRFDDGDEREERSTEKRLTASIPHLSFCDIIVTCCTRIPSCRTYKEQSSRCLSISMQHNLEPYLCIAQPCRAATADCNLFCWPSRWRWWSMDFSSSYIMCQGYHLLGRCRSKAVVRCKWDFSTTYSKMHFQMMKVSPETVSRVQSKDQRIP